MATLKFKPVIASLVAATYLFASIGTTQACTSLMTMDKNGNAYHGRGMEFSTVVPMTLTYIPAATHIESYTPAGKQGVTFDTKYAILAMTATVLPKAKQASVVQGSNDQGLSFSSNELNNSSAPPVGNDPAKILSVSDLGFWILGNFKTTAEVKAAMTNGGTDFWLPNIPLFDNVALPQHYAVHDKKGGAIVIEFYKGKVNVYDNPVGVLTNGPEFPWHLENLNNYTFTNVDKNSGQLGKLKLATSDAGIALAGLPSAQTATGRFVKAAFYANYVRKGKTPDEAINILGHILNNFDRPYDLTVDAAGGAGDGPRGNKQSSESTTWMVMHDLAQNRSYVRTINALNWSVIDMNQLKDLKTMKSVSLFDVDKAGANAFTLFLK